jgi:hypothetical protein
MKYLTHIIIPIILASCNSTKQITNNNSKDLAQTHETTKGSVNAKKEQDSVKIIQKFKKETENSTLYKKDNLENQNLEKPVNTNQTVTKYYKTLHQSWDELLQIHVSEKGHVNYLGFKKDHKKLLDYINILNLTYSNGDFPSFSKEEKLAYWINTYNAFTIDLILRHYPLKSIKDIKEPWKQRYWQLGDKWFNLNEIEHGILRKMNEPRIHFAINCASVSCPKLQNRAFIAKNLEDALTLATKEFLNDPSKNILSEDKIIISKIFQWFAKDFKQYGSLIDFLNTYSNTKASKKATKRFMDYNWELNE